MVGDLAIEAARDDEAQQNASPESRVPKIDTVVGARSDQRR